MTFSQEEYETDFIEAWNEHDLRRVLAYYDDDLVYTHPGQEPKIVRGKQVFELYLKGFWNTLPDSKFKLIAVAWNGFTGFGEWILASSFSGKRYGLLVKNRRIEVRGVDALVINPTTGRIREERVYFSPVELLKQIGVDFDTLGIQV